MKGRTEKVIWIVVATCGLAVGVTSAEEEMQVYESLDKVLIGRVFLSPEQRDRLDDRRGKVTPVAASAVVSATRPRANKSPNAAGYILRSGGPSRVWANGNFVAVDDVSKVKFPGDIEVRRESAIEPVTSTGAADDGS